MYTISNNKITIIVASRGAELQSLINNETGLEYMWDAGAAWPKKSPVLFPIVGGLKNSIFRYAGREYRMSRHGFARDLDFKVHDQTEDSMTFMIESNEETKRGYPFDFQFLIKYALVDNAVNITYFVDNMGMDEMFFSVGGHPAFKVPLTGDSVYEDYYLSFMDKENAGRWPLSADGLLLNSPLPLFTGTELWLTRKLFYGDALVFKHLNSNVVSLLNNKNKHGLSLSFPDFPFLGIWAAKDADFVCIEPWCGVADTENTSGSLIEKEGINSLEPGAVFERNFSIGVF